MSHSTWIALNKAIEAQGYQFKDNVMLPSDSCDEADCCCPACGRGGYWCVWYTLPENEQKEAWAQLCYDCGHMWTEYVDRGDEIPDNADPDEPISPVWSEA